MTDLLPGVPTPPKPTQKQERAEARARHEALVALFSEQLRPRVVARVAEIMDREIDAQFRRCAENAEFMTPDRRYLSMNGLIIAEIQKAAVAKVAERLRLIEVSVRLPDAPDA